MLFMRQVLGAVIATLVAAPAVPAWSQSADRPSTASPARVTILYDAFGKDSSVRKDWGFSALVEVAGKRILFDTGNDADIFAANAKAKGVDITTLDFVVVSHRHGDHIAGIPVVLKLNPKVKIYGPKEGFGIFGSSLPGSFYRKNENLPPEQRYYDGQPPEVMQFGAAWKDANVEAIDKTTEIAPGVWLIALVSDAPGTKELKELSLAIDTPHGLILIVGCSHPGIERIVEAASAINPKIHYVVGGFHMINAKDDEIAKVAASLRDTWKVQNIAPGHCTGEITFAALRAAFGDRYVYAGAGTELNVGKSRRASSQSHVQEALLDETAASRLHGEVAALTGSDLEFYRTSERISHDAVGHAH